MIDRHHRERAEVERSDIEARTTADASLLIEERELARYVAPPRETAYPLEYAFALLGDVEGRTVLDLGCGSGRQSLVLARRGARPVGVDISASLIALARRRLDLHGLGRRARFVVGSVHDLPIASDSIDVVLGIQILHHVDVADAAREVSRVLRPGGLAVFQEPVRDSRLIRALRRLIPFRHAAVSPFERPLTTSELQLFAARFRWCAMRPFALPFVRLAHVVRRLQRYEPLAHRLDRAILARFPAAAPYSATRVVCLAK